MSFGRGLTFVWIVVIVVLEVLIAWRIRRDYLIWCNIESNDELLARLAPLMWALVTIPFAAYVAWLVVRWIDRQISN